MEKKGETNFFTSEMIKACMRKVVTVNLHQVVQVSVPSEYALSAGQFWASWSGTRRRSHPGKSKTAAFSFWRDFKF